MACTERGLVDGEEVALEYHSCRVQVIDPQVSTCIYRIRLPGLNWSIEHVISFVLYLKLLVSYPIHLSPGSTSGTYYIRCVVFVSYS